MKRRAFIRTGSLIGAAGAAGALGLGITRSRVSRETAPGTAAGAASRTGPPERRFGTDQTAEPDLVLRRATVFDGTGASGLELDVAVTGDRITEVGTITATGSEEIDLAGMALAPASAKNLCSGSRHCGRHRFFLSVPQASLAHL